MVGLVLYCWLEDLMNATCSDINWRLSHSSRVMTQHLIWPSSPSLTNINWVTGDDNTSDSQHNSPIIILWCSDETQENSLWENVLLICRRYSWMSSCFFISNLWINMSLILESLSSRARWSLITANIAKIVHSDKWYTF